MQTLNIWQQDVAGIEVVDRHIEESLDLVGMQIHGDETVDTGYAEQVSYELGTDAHTGLVLAVLTCPTEVGDDGDDVTGRGALGCIDHQQQLHQIVRIGEGALNQENITAAD